MDDDNYVILPSLLQLLSSYHHSQDVYLGRPSLDHPIEAAERVKSDGSVSQFVTSFWLHLALNSKLNPDFRKFLQKATTVSVSFQVSVKFWFATGGAGFCISRGLALKMSPWARSVTNSIDL